MESYLETTVNVYQKAALSPNEGLCCTTNPIWQLPGLTIPDKTAAKLAALNRSDIFISDSTWYYNGGGCC